MPGRLDNRVCLITGAAMGIGLAIAERLAREGSRVILADVKPTEGEAAAARLRAAGLAADFLKLDVTSESDWITAAGQIGEAHGGLDALVANAGIESVGAIADVTLDQWRRALDVNLTGVYLATRHMAPLLAKRGAARPSGASIVNISSILGIGGMAGSSAYSATKGGVRLFTKSIALEFARDRKNIRVNSVHPGFIRTPMTENAAQRIAQSGGAASGTAVIDGMVALTPMGRIGTPEDIAAGVAFLISDDAAFMTGAELVIDGGYTAQ
jgi:NAD(P)-dependent dehydrogenase (short-subunit alcohol dehydrogenase family)